MKQELKDIASILSTVLDFVANEVPIVGASRYRGEFADAREKLRLLAEPAAEPVANDSIITDLASALEKSETRSAKLENSLRNMIEYNKASNPHKNPLLTQWIFEAKELVDYYREDDEPIANDSIITEPKLKLEVGKRYVLRNGDVVGPLKLSSRSTTFPFTAGGLSWKANGDYLSLATHTHDIVSEYVEPKLKLEAGKKYVLRNGDVVGPLKLRANVVSYPFAFGGRIWMTDGRYNTVVQPHSLDIVSEYAEPQYRILNPGERIREGDEVSNGGGWGPASFVGGRVVTYRRRIN